MTAPGKRNKDAEGADQKTKALTDVDKLAKDGKDESNADIVDAKKKKRKRLMHNLIFLLEVGFALALITSFVPINGKPVGYLTYEVLTNRSEFCMNCHIMETRFASWKRSSHAKVTVCMDCHSEPGFVGEWKAHLDGMRYIWAMITKKRSGSVIQAHVKNVSCLECHEEYRTMKDVVYHNLHERAGVLCTACHDNLMVHRVSLIPPEHSYGAHNCQDCHNVDDPMFGEIVEKYRETILPKIPEVKTYRPPR